MLLNDWKEHLFVIEDHKKIVIVEDNWIANVKHKWFVIVKNNLIFVSEHNWIIVARGNRIDIKSTIGFSF